MENSVEELCFFGIFRGNKIVKLARNGLIKFASYFFTGFFLEIFRTEWLPFKDAFFNCWSWLITWLTWSRNLLWIESVVRKLYTRLMSQVRTSSIVSPYQRLLLGQVLASYHIWKLKFQERTPPLLTMYAKSVLWAKT